MVSKQNDSKLGRVQNMAIRATVAAALFAFQAAVSPVAAAGGPFSSGKMVGHMTRKLNLSDAQAQQVQQIFDSRQAQMTAQFQALKSARQALHQATLANPVNEGAIRGAAQALAQAEGDAAVLRAQVHAQILPLLNADQQQKFSALEEGHRGHWSRDSRAPVVSQ